MGADPVNGFRVAGTNLPVAAAAPAVEPLAAPVFDLPLPVAVEDTAEVAAAKAEFAAAYDAAAAAAAAAPEEPAAERKRRDADEEAAAAPLAAPVAAPVAVAAPLAAAAPSREAVLTTVKLNPGHAISYRVD